MKHSHLMEKKPSFYVLSVELMRSYSSNKAGVMPVAGRVGWGLVLI